MKTVFFTLLALSGCLCACSDSDSKYDDLDNTPVNAVSIRVGQPSIDKVSRAVVEDGVDLTATLVMCDGQTASWGGFTPKTTNEIDASRVLLSRANITDVTFNANENVGQDVTLPIMLYYDNITTTNKSWLTAVSPKGTLSGTTLTFATKDGEQDVMVASDTDAGSHLSPTSPIQLNFAHKTTQLSIAVKLKTYTPDFGGAWYGKKAYLKSVTLQNAEVPSAFEIKTSSIAWQAAANLNIPGIDNPEITASAAKVGRAVMTNASSEIFVDAVITIEGTDVNFNNIPVMDATVQSTKLQTVIGQSHLITITVVEPAAADGSVPVTSIEATIQPWIVGSEGSATLE